MEKKFTVIREVLNNNYQSHTLIGLYHFWLIHVSQKIGLCSPNSFSQKIGLCSPNSFSPGCGCGLGTRLGTECLSHTHGNFSTPTQMWNKDSDNYMGTFYSALFLSPPSSFFPPPSFHSPSPLFPPSPVPHLYIFWHAIFSTSLHRYVCECYRLVLTVIEQSMYLRQESCCPESFRW